MATTPFFYTIEQVADLLSLHVKTVRRYVREGRLKARRIGKAYRIARRDLENFAGETPPVPAVSRARHIVASSIVDIDAISSDEGGRVTTLMMAALNARKGEADFPRVDSIYYPEQAKLRITITASLELSSSLLRLINSLLQDGRDHDEHL